MVQPFSKVPEGCCRVVVTRVKAARGYSCIDQVIDYGIVYCENGPISPAIINIPSNQYIPPEFTIYDNEKMVNLRMNEPASKNHFRIEGIPIAIVGTEIGKLTSGGTVSWVRKAGRFRYCCFSKMWGVSGFYSVTEAECIDMKPGLEYNLVVDYTSGIPASITIRSLSSRSL